MPYRMLIVDDSPAMRTFIGRVVEISGFDCDPYLEAGDGEEALKVLDREWVDVILTDINMPNMNGEQLVERLETDDRLSSIPVLVISTDGTAKRIDRLMSKGADGYVTKPFTPEVLREELERLLGVPDE